jgi:hypothetical protein
MRAQFFALTLCCSFLTGASGCAPGILWACARPEITAVSLNSCDGEMCGKEAGIPFYLPKPLLIVSKNFRNIETPTIGLTDTAPIPNGYDDQSKYADLNARTSFNGLNGPGGTGDTAPNPASSGTNTGTATRSAPTLHTTGVPLSPTRVPGDGLSPETFFTYQIVYVPDMTKRYGLKIRGGPGEMRAAMNLVNGWQFTGTGPFYLKDSSTAQNILASGISTRLGGAAAADVLNASANLAKAFPGGKQAGEIPSDDARLQKLTETIGQLPRDMVPMPLVNFAEIHVYEPSLTPDGQMSWNEIVNLHFNRDYLGMKTVVKDYKVAEAPKKTPTVPLAGGQQAGVIGTSTDDAVARAAVASIFGLPGNTPALSPAPGSLQSGALGGVPTGGVNQIQVDCGGKCSPSKEFNLFKFCGLGLCGKEPRPKIQNRILTQTPLGVPGGFVEVNPENVNTETPKKTGAGGGAQSGTLPGTTPAIINQPIFNNPGYPPQVPAAPPTEKKN